MVHSRELVFIAVVTALLWPGVGRSLQDLALSVTPNVKVTVNVSQTHEVPESLYGIFFEEVSCRFSIFLFDSHHCKCL